MNFSKVATLEEMVGHIYGRTSLLANPARPHLFLRELAINIDFLREELGKVAARHPLLRPRLLPGISR